MKMKLMTTLLTVGMAATLLFPTLASAASSTQVVRESNVSRQAEDTPPLKNWVIYNRTVTPNTATFRSGPMPPPLGSGSLELSTPTSGDKVTIFNYDYNGKQLSDVDALGYSTYKTSGDAPQVAALNVQVDVNGAAPGGFTTLVFEPVYNTNQGAIANDTWQTWDAYKGGDAIWWSSNPIPGAPNRDTFVSWDTIVAANPDAVISGGIGINQGSGNPALTTAVDALKIGVAGNTTIFDFEDTPVRATTKEQCKDGGYKNFQTEYKNQGDCVSDVASNGKAKGNPTKSDDSVITSLKHFLGL